MLDFQVLTKRPENVAAMVPQMWYLGHWPAHVWIGTSVENQEQADRRIPELLRIPAAVRFLSVEPLLGPVTLEDWLGNMFRCNRCGFSSSDYKTIPLDRIPRPCCGKCDHGLPQQRVEILGQGIQWVIVGGESGPNAWPMHPDWARAIRDECAAAGVPFFFKQWGEWQPLTKPGLARQIARVNQNGEWHSGDEYQDDQMIYKTGFIDDRWQLMVKVGKHTAGRLLDGREWNEFPTASVKEETQLALF
jgi:protein gp37